MKHSLLSITILVAACLGISHQAGARQPNAKARPAALPAPKATANSTPPVFPSRSDSILNYRESAPEYVFDTIPFWWKGEFHLFYLNGVFDNEGKKTGVKWSHSKTKDYVHWEKLPDALLPGDIDMNVWTGSLIEKDGVFHLFYTGKSLPPNPDPKGDQKVMVATSTDLVTFTKQPQRTFYADGKFNWSKPINGPLRKGQGNDETFRDPEVTWIPERNEYRMLLHSRHPETQEHQFGAYRSDDLVTWTPREALQTVETGKRNLDCPDLFPLGGRWHLVFSGCRAASADRPEGPFGPHRSYENNHYVGKVAFDDKGRALTVATVRPGVGFTDKEGKTTGGVGGRASMIREFYTTKQGRLAQRPLPEVLAAFSNTTHTLDDLARAIVTGKPERLADGIRLTGGKESTRLRLDGVAEDFLAEFTVTLAADSVFRVNFRQSGPQTYFFEASTKDNHVRIGTPWHHSDSTEAFADRGIQLPVGKPIRVRLFATGDIIECFVEDIIALTINAYDLHGPKLAVHAPQGEAVVHDFRVATSAPPIRSPQSAIQNPKDVLFIAVDDLNTWTTLFDPSHPIRTPNLERLAARGAFFSRAYCAAPACNPSRAATLSGMRPTTSGLYNNPDKLENHHRDTVFLPQYFQQHGYRTWGIGKILHGEPLHAGDSTRAIFQKFQPMDKSLRPKTKLNGLTSGPGKAATYDWGEMTGKLSDGITVGKAVEWMSEPREGPAFQAVGIFSPHLPHYARAEHFARYPEEKPLLPPMPKNDFDDIPAAGRAMSDFQKQWNHQLFTARDQGDPAPLSGLVRSYCAAATYGDEMLGKLLDALDATGRADNTIIVLWSDHGYHLGDKDSVVKFTLWEQATHVPLVIIAPGVTRPGTRIETPVSLVDLYPTLVELAGLPPKPGLDGASLVPLLKNPAATRPPALTTWLRGNHGIRTRDWRYIRYADGSEELYKDSDPWNHENLAAKPESASVIADHRRWLPENEAPGSAPPATIPKEKPKTNRKAPTP
jgi:arylsulfatase A-like enzyme/sucrose-6-phosphate hydrolase SacC (GH32 family)